MSMLSAPEAGIRPADSVSWQKKTAELAMGRLC